MSAAGTCAATAELTPEPAAGVEDVFVDEPALDVVVELLLLLLPQPTITAALSSATSAADRRVQELLKSNSFSGEPQFRARISNN
ncbi:MAG: hypothetical protein ACXVFQ_21465 [Solirubrobacteraceae bacterium]